MLWLPPEIARRIRFLGSLSLTLGLGGMIVGVWSYYVGPLLSRVVDPGPVVFALRVGVAFLFAAPLVLAVWLLVVRALPEVIRPNDGRPDRRP